MSVKVLIVEDEILIAENLEADLEDLGYTVLDIALSSNECFDSLSKVKPDVILMDIQIQGDLNGIEVVEKINETMSIPVIYLTSNTDPVTMNKALATKPHSFISKPYNLNDLQAAIEIAFQGFNQQENSTDNSEPINSVFVKSGEHYHRVNFDEILYAVASGSYCVVTTLQEDFVLSMILQNFMNKLSDPCFIRSHRSFLVNITKVEKFDNSSVYIKSKEIPISKSNRVGLFKHLNRL